jgi:hypothetical protein
MRTIDHRVIHAPPAVVWPLAANVDAWPALLPHYRWVTRHGADLVEMAAWRPFGWLRWPVWWESEMAVDPEQHRITYRHVRGITSGMDVLWTIDRVADHANEWSDVTIVHEWSGPRWPVIGPLAARRIIGPVFVHGIASRTLAGIAQRAERQVASRSGQ